MKSIGSVFALALLGLSASAFANPTVKGTIEIQYLTRTQTRDDGLPMPGVVDLYKIDINVDNSAQFVGEIRSMPPLVAGGFFSPSDVQQGRVDYSVDLYSFNPKNPAQKKVVGRLYGAVPVDTKGVYRYNDGTLKVGINSVGTAKGFESKFAGLANGRAPAPPRKEGEEDQSLMARLKRAKQSVTKMVNGVPKQIIVANYDKMDYVDVALAGGPSADYPEARVNGTALYDYERKAWLFQGLRIGDDRISGNILWLANPNKDGGTYQFDVRVNEPEVSGTAAQFEESAGDGDFWGVDPNVKALTGTMTYRDTATSSTVTVDLVGAGLTRPQTMALAKLFLCVNAVPMNSD
jgi:hypothetical protein